MSFYAKEVKVRRLEAQRNDWNAKVRFIKEELAITRTWFLRRRGSETDGQEKGPCQSSSRGQVRRRPCTYH